MDNKNKYMEFMKGKRQEISFKVEVEDGVVQKIHNAYIYQPIIHNDRKLYGVMKGK